jgi:chromatin structure-remodeling complex protein RSC7
MPFKKGHKGHPRKSLGSKSRHNPTPTPRPIHHQPNTDIQSGSPAPVIKEDGSDDEMTDRVPDADGDVDVDANRDATPLEGAGEDDDEAHTPAPDEEDDEDDGPPQITTIPRRRGRGRGPGRPPKSHLDMPDVGDDGSESGTPFKRKRGRPVGSGRGGFRGRRKGAPPEAPHVMFEGTKYDVVNDEAQIDQDDEGDEKVDENGHLLGGREYRVRTFTIEGRGEKLYMLSTEPARCCGFRDSYLFFTKHPKLYKVLVNDAEKKDLIEREVLPSSYKGRNIGVVVARSVFREFGARIIVGGRRIIDDYKVSQARADGFVEGELADPDDAVPGKDEQYNRNRYVAWFGASEVYRNTAGAGAPGGGKPAPIGGKRRNNITLGNWQTMHASDARYVQIISEVDECITNLSTAVSTPSWQPTAEQHTLAYTTLTRT